MDDVKKEIKRKNPNIGTKIKAVPKPQPEIGVDTEENFLTTVIKTAISNNIDISKLEGFSAVTQTREQIYRLIDTMAEDPILASYLKTISSDAVETNDSGQIVWCESDDAKCAKYVTYLLDSINVDKNAYRWMHALIKYGDCYLRLYRESDYKQDELFQDKQDQINEREELNEEVSAGELKEEAGTILKEQVNLNVHGPKDHYVNYVEMVPNPGEMFELTKFGKTCGYIEAPVNIQVSKSTGAGVYAAPYMMYKMKKNDVDVYGAMDFVHGCLDDNSSRVPEEVDIFNTEKDLKAETGAQTYTVKRGQSELASMFKIWRQLSLLENSALLNRITKSAIVRTIEVEVGDMPKEQIGGHLQAVKSLFEQKTAINEGHYMQEYTNPGPIENDIFIPVREGKGHITANTIGGDFDPKQLSDIDYFQDKLFGALGIPKAFFGVTDDGAGFNGGTSLSIQSSRYGKSVKRIQNAFIQMITDLVNVFLFDRGLRSYINKFTIRMQAPVTQEEIDRREAKKNKIGVVGDIMLQLADIQDPVVKLKILKSLLSDSLSDVAVIDELQKYIDDIESGEEPKPEEGEGGEGPEAMPSFENEGPTPPSAPMPELPPEASEAPERTEEPTGETNTEVIEPASDSFLPSPSELGIDATDNSQF